MKATQPEIDRALNLLSETPTRLAEISQEQSEEKLRASPGGKGWSAVEILAHLRACADLWGYSILAMLAHEQPELPLLDERKWAKTARYNEEAFQASLLAFRAQRESLLRVLIGLPFERWSRTAVIAGRGHSVFSQARRMALHEMEHCAQLEALFHPVKQPDQT